MNPSIPIERVVAMFIQDVALHPGVAQVGLLRLGQKPAGHFEETIPQIGGALGSVCLIDTWD